MGRRMSYLEKIKKTGAYRFRRAIPAHLQPYFPDRGAFWREHLGTKVEEEARVLCLEWSAKVENLFQQAQTRLEAERSGTTAPQSSLTIEWLSALLADWKREERARRARLIVVGDVMPGWPEFLAECRLAGACDLKPEFETPDAFLGWLEDQEAFVDRAISEMTTKRAVLLEKSHPAHAILSNLFLTTWVEVLEAEHRWRLLDFSDLPAHLSDPPPPKTTLFDPSKPPEPTQSAPPGAPSTSPVKDPEILFSTAFDEWARLSKPAHRTMTEARTAMRQFIELHGDLPIRAIEKRHARAFRDAIAVLPKNLNADQKALPLPALVEASFPGERRQPQSINKILNLLSGVLSRAEREGRFDHMMWANPFSVHLDVEEEDEDSYEPFTAPELKRLFASPVFASAARPKQGRGETAYWAPLIALYHGARRGEVLQLFVRDIRHDEEAGVEFIDINRDDGKLVKNGESIRRAPLHPRLISMGFLEFVVSRRALVGDDASLWPGFEDRSKMEGRINRWSKWFGGYLVDHVVDEPTKKFHSFRGTFKRFGKDCDVNADILDRICGHAIASEGGKYGRKTTSGNKRDSGYSLAKLHKEISAIKFPYEEMLIMEKFVN